MARYRITCQDCGARVMRNMKAGRSKVCTPCGLIRAERAALEMAAKSGPAWDAYVARTGALGRRGAPRDDHGRFAPDIC